MEHWTESLTNVAASVVQQLRNMRKESGEDMQLLLARYATERLMYRISRSPYKDVFVLKGAWLFYMWGVARRATRDVDFLASVDRTEIEAAFREIIAVEVDQEDGVRFDADSIRLDEIQEDGDYVGLRLRMVAQLGRTRIHVQVDMGFSEALVEEPVRTELPVLLDFDRPEIRVYSPEAVIAEKLEAVIKLGTINTRFKDFFDLYLLSHERSFEGVRLREQVQATLRHRATEAPTTTPRGISDEFARSDEAQRAWKAFVRRSAAEGAPEEFADVAARIREFVGPVLDAVSINQSLDADWDPHRGWARR
jgi:predicted nucleotidyltransferase component of viral defense system